MASVGLTAALSGRAATFAVLGAGAKVVAVEAGYLDDDALERLRRARPHLPSLSGGVDGGNSDALRYNAARLASLHDVCGVAIAGNRRAAEGAAATLAERGRDVRVVDNVFPAPGELTIAPSREAIRELFMLHITVEGPRRLDAEAALACERRRRSAVPWRTSAASPWRWSTSRTTWTSTHSWRRRRPAARTAAGARRDAHGRRRPRRARGRAGDRRRDGVVPGGSGCGGACAAGASRPRARRRSRAGRRRNPRRRRRRDRGRRHTGDVVVRDLSSREDMRCPVAT